MGAHGEGDGDAMLTPGRPRAAFVGVTYAGWSTRQQNLERHVLEDGRFDATFRHVTGWEDGGFVERLPLPRRARGRARALLQARALAAFPRPDIVWTSCQELAVPYAWAFSGPFDCPFVVETDWAIDQQEAFAPLYFGRSPRSGLSLRIARWQERTVLQRADAVIAMSRWAAAGLRDAGVPDGRVHVIPPGVDLEMWSAPKRRAKDAGPLRVLFVGGSFGRKGGDLLVDAVSGPLAGRCELDIVTRDDVAPRPGIRVHRADPNSPELRALFESAEIFAMPTRAECFGQVFVEALASGLPVIAGRSGGTGDIVDHGETGWLVEPSLQEVVAALERALALRDTLPAMGRRGREVAEARFDGRKNDTRLLDLMLELVDRHGGRRSAA